MRNAVQKRRCQGRIVAHMSLGLAMTKIPITGVSAAVRSLLEKIEIAVTESLSRSGRKGIPRWESRVIGGQTFVVLALLGYGIAAFPEVEFVAYGEGVITAALQKCIESDFTPPPIGPSDS